MSIVIKASEIANLTDARYFSAMGVDLLGFVLDPSHPAHLSTTQVAAMREWLSGPRIVGEFGAMADGEALLQAVASLSLDAIQVGAFTPISVVSSLKGKCRIIREQVIESLDELNDLEFAWREWDGTADLFLLDLEKNGFSWAQLAQNENALSAVKNLCQYYPVLLSLPFAAAALETIIETLQPQGLSFKGGAEERVGVKSFEQLDEIFDTLSELNC